MRMSFENKNTWFRAMQAGGLDALHAAYEAAWSELQGRLGATHGHQIGGKAVAGAGSFALKTSPSDTRLLVGRFVQGTQAEALAAVAAAKAAFPAWRATPWQERAAMLDRVADVMTRRFWELCVVMTVENGKNRFEASIDVDEGIDFCRSYAAQMRAHNGFVTTMGSPFPGEHNETRFLPWGVFAVIAPFNFPIAITAGMVVGALVTGNTVVLKPTQDTPLCGELVYECIAEAGVPAGVLNLVHGSGSVVGQALVDSDEVDGFVFTGSVGVGLQILHSAQKKCAKPVIAEMGGKNPIVVTSKADIAKAVDGVYNAAFGFSGQKCSACSRLYLHQDIAEDFLARLATKMKSVVVGHPAAKDTYMGPIINARALKTYLDAAAQAKRDGGRFVAGGAQITDGDCAHGYFVQPAVVAGLPASHELFHRELFVPFVAVDNFATLEEALRKANDVEFGLTAGIFTEDESERDFFFTRIEAGVTYCNRRRGGSTGAVVDAQTFVGWKNSGTTGRGAGGRNYLQQFMREQSRTIVSA
ncbi:MAG: aldehyde dehydrogenase family protein [Planctomycetes bacterium]|nr:aldehyde dehydrogenase family protein [Planctomycetota bacterium]